VRALPTLQISRCTPTDIGGSIRGLRRRKRNAGPPRFGQTDGNSLLNRTRPVLSFSDVFDFLTDELSGLRRGRFALLFVAFRPFDCFFWHGKPRPSKPIAVLSSSSRAEPAGSFGKFRSLRVLPLLLGWPSTQFFLEEVPSLKEMPQASEIKKEKKSKPAQPSRLVFSQGTRAHLFFP